MTTGSWTTAQITRARAGTRALSAGDPLARRRGARAPRPARRSRRRRVAVARTALEKARGCVDGERQDRRVEHERQDRLEDDQPAHLARRDGNVGSLRGDGDGEGEIEKV